MTARESRQNASDQRHQIKKECADLVDGQTYVVNPVKGSHEILNQRPCRLKGQPWADTKASNQTN